MIGASSGSADAPTSYRHSLSIDPAVIAILRASRVDRFTDATMTLHAAGITATEFPLTTPHALSALRECRSALPDSMKLGAGTVLTPHAAQQAVESGASYLVTPAFCPDTIAEANRLGVPIVSGAATPTEILSAWRAGAAMVKVFPAASLGGPSYIQALRGPLPDILLAPTGGFGIDEVVPYFEAGATAIGIGSQLIGDACEGGSLDALHERATTLIEKLASIRSTDR